MKVIGFFFLVIVLQLTHGNEASENQKNNDESFAITNINHDDVSNFFWTIKNFNIIEWKLTQNPKAIMSPQLKDKNERKTNCSVIPTILNNGLLGDTIKPKLICEFDPEPAVVKYWNHGGKFGRKFSVEIFPNDIIGNEISFEIKAFYSTAEFSDKPFYLNKMAYSDK